MPSENNKETLDERDRKLLSAVALRISYDITIFAERLRGEIETFRESGLNEQSIIGVLSQDFNNNGRIFGELRNSFKRRVIGGINQAFRRSRPMGQKLRWVAISKNVCSDCKGRAGEIDTIEGWESRGLPSSGWSLCRDYCYCQLMPEGFETDDIIKL
jgi:hypothetical protein